MGDLPAKSLAEQASVDDVEVYLNAPAANTTTSTLVKEVVGHKSDADVWTIGTTHSIVAYVKGVLQRLLVAPANGTFNNSWGDVIGNKTDSTVTAVGTDKSLAAYTKGILSQTGAPGVDSTSNANVTHNLGSKLDAAQTVVGTTRSVMAYVKGIVNQVRTPSTPFTRVAFGGTPDVLSDTGFTVLKSVTGRGKLTTVRFKDLSGTNRLLEFRITIDGTAYYTGVPVDANRIVYLRVVPSSTALPGDPDMLWAIPITGTDPAPINCDIVFDTSLEVAAKVGTGTNIAYETVIGGQYR